MLIVKCVGFCRLMHLKTSINELVRNSTWRYNLGEGVILRGIKQASQK